MIPKLQHKPDFLCAIRLHFQHDFGGPLVALPTSYIQPKHTQSWSQSYPLHLFTNTSPPMQIPDLRIMY